MALLLQWPFKFTESKTVKTLKNKIERLEERGTGMVSVHPDLLQGLWDDGSTSVNEDTAMTLSAVYSAINILCDSINIPVEIYRREADGNRSPVDKTYPYEFMARNLLHISPNKMMTPSGWFQLMEMSRVIYGNGYSLILRNNINEPLALKWYHPNNVEVKVVGSELRYWFKNSSGAAELSNITSADVIHVKNMSFDGVMGMGVIDIAKDSLTGGLSGQKSSNNFYKSGMTSKVVLQHPGQLSGTGKKNLQDSFEAELQKRSTIVTEEGVKIFSLTIPPEQAQFLQSRVFSVTEVARWFNIPEHMLGNNQNSTFSNIENQFLQFIINNVRPRVRMWEQELNTKLLNNTYDFYVEFNMDALLRADLKSQAEYFVSAIQNGWMTRNEVRMMKNLNRIDGLDEPLSMLNLATETEREQNVSTDSQTTQ